MTEPNRSKHEGRVYKKGNTKGNTIGTKLLHISIIMIGKKVEKEDTIANSVPEKTIPSDATPILNINYSKPLTDSGIFSSIRSVIPFFSSSKYESEVTKNVIQILNQRSDFSGSSTAFFQFKSVFDDFDHKNSYLMIILSVHTLTHQPKTK